MKEKQPLKYKPPPEDMKKSGVYLIHSDDYLIMYVGSAVNFGNRLAGHKLDCRRGKGNKVLQAYTIINQWKDLSFKILEIVENLENLKDRENYWINYFGFENLSNTSPDAKTLKGTKMPDSHRKKSSERMMGNTISVGYKHSPEKGIKCAKYWADNPEKKAVMIEKNRESQRKINRSNWQKGYIIEVTFNNEIIDKLHGCQAVYDKYPIGHLTISKLLTGKKEEYNGYKLKYIGKFFRNENISREEYFNEE